MNDKELIQPVGTYAANRHIIRVDIELPKGEDSPFTRAICIGDNGAILDVSEANDINDIAGHYATAYQIERSYVLSRHSFRRNYNQRFVAAEKWNDESARKCGLMSQFEAGNNIYSVITHHAYRIARPMLNDEQKEGYIEAVIQIRDEPDADKALVEQAVFDTLYEAIVWIRNQIEKDLFITFASGNVSV